MWVYWVYLLLLHYLSVLYNWLVWHCLFHQSNGKSLAIWWYERDSPSVLRSCVCSWCTRMLSSITQNQQSFLPNQFHENLRNLGAFYQIRLCSSVWLQVGTFQGTEAKFNYYIKAYLWLIKIPQSRYLPKYSSEAKKLLVSWIAGSLIT